MNTTFGIYMPLPDLGPCSTRLPIAGGLPRRDGWSRDTATFAEFDRQMTSELDPCSGAMTSITSMPARHVNTTPIYAPVDTRHLGWYGYQLSQTSQVRPNALKFQVAILPVDVSMLRSNAI
ncbi:unnamed protein product [Thelazia callipaeda]|uniref:Uncharacterized protein n=1 Tax=Thelazia callipaeda TaxID=103827 RepID=A0A0N5D175_THECL|nr:unnamed protein product [Thelazia callipaeda]